MLTTDRRTRADRARAAIDSAGIVMMSLHGRAAAAAFLEGERVPFRVIVRVLAEPGQRRAPPPHHFAHEKST